MKVLGKHLPQKLRMTSSGFTLIELMVTIAVLAIIVGIAAPSISNQLANQRVKSTTATLANALKEAKSESMIRRQAIKVIHDNSAHTIMLTVDEGSKDEISTYQYDAKSIISWGSDINFKPNKTAEDKSYTVCDSNEKANTRTITVSKLGSVSIELGGSC